jgi:hypothetical protein
MILQTPKNLSIKLKIIIKRLNHWIYQVKMIKMQSMNNTRKSLMFFNIKQVKSMTHSVVLFLNIKT